MVYAENQEAKRAEKFVDLATRAKEKVDELMNFIEGIEDEIEIPQDIITLYEDGDDKLNDAKAELEKPKPDFELAVQLAEEAMNIFRDVYEQLHTFLEEEEVTIESENEVEGLLEAIDRAGERISRVRGLMGVTPLTEDAEDILEDLLGDAEDLLEDAVKALEDGNVSMAAHNLGDANKLISQAFVTLKKASGAIHSGKLKGFLTVIRKFYERVERLVKRAEEKGLGVSAYYDELHEGPKSIQSLIDKAEDEKDLEEAVAYLMEARMRLEKIQDEIRESMKGGPEGD